MKAAAKKQKPNDACACKSGLKYKRCCAGGGALTPAAGGTQPAAAGGAQPASGSRSNQLNESTNKLKRLMHEATVAEEEEGDLPRAVRRVTAAVAVAGELLLACARVPGATGLRMTTTGSDGAVLVRNTTYDDVAFEGAVVSLDFLVSLNARVGSLVAAEDALARVVALLCPPHQFYVRGLTTMSHAAWRTLHFCGMCARTWFGRHDFFVPSCGVEA
jgi:hypothetical protein